MEEAHLSPELIRRYWTAKRWRPDDTFNLYVDSPFCVQQCRFCMLNSTYLADVSRGLLNEYYSLLAQELHEWRDVLACRQIDTAYFGGGTSSLMSAEQMARIFDAIPSIIEIDSKCFECDPLSLSSAKIDVLSDYGFTYVTFGLQTLDPIELARQSRINPSPTRLQELTAGVLAHGMKVSIDIMAFLDDDLEADLKRVRNDLSFLLSVVKPTAIDVYPMKPKLEGHYADALAKVAALRHCLKDVLDQFSKYRTPNEEDVLSLRPDDILWADRYRNYLLINMDPNDYFSNVKRYSCSNVAYAPTTQNTIAFGGYGHREAYSYADEKTMVYYSRYRPDLRRFTYRPDLQQGVRHGRLHLGARGGP